MMSRLIQVDGCTLPSPILDYRSLFTTVLIDRELNKISKSALIVFIDHKEPERLQSAGERWQHLCCAQHCPRVGQEHQFDARALIQRAGQVQQSACDGNDLQLASNLTAALEAKDSRGRVRKLQSRRSPIGFGLQDLCPSRTHYVPEFGSMGHYRRTCPKAARLPLESFQRVPHPSSFLKGRIPRSSPAWDFCRDSRIGTRRPRHGHHRKARR
jgi:hypothetical protein